MEKGSQPIGSQPIDRELPNNLILTPVVCDEDAFPNICHLLVITWTLLITKLIVVFADEMNQDLL